MPKILIVTLKFPFPMQGACETDCAKGILQFQRLGFDVKVITKITSYQSIEKVREVSKELGIEMTPVTYKMKGCLSRLLTNPLILDGAAFEYHDPEMKQALKDKIINWQPDLVWFDCTHMWPLYGIVKKYNTPIFTRSQNFEPLHLLEEHGFNLLGYVRFLPKLVSEIMTVKKSDVIFAIAPKEAKIYKKLGAKEVAVLPTRGLWECLKESRKIEEKEKLNVFYLGSSYNVFHMREDARFIIKEIVPRINKLAPNKFSFHFFGAKFPKEFANYMNDQVIYEGYVEDLEKSLENMDIAVVPSFRGAGMKKKVYEPLCRGFPTITSFDGVAGYPLEPDRHILLASNADEFAQRLLELQDVNLRRNLSKEAMKICNKLFSRQAFDLLVSSAVYKFIKKPGDNL